VIFRIRERNGSKRNIFRNLVFLFVEILLVLSVPVVFVFLLVLVLFEVRLYSFFLPGLGYFDSNTTVWLIFFNNRTTDISFPV
jgi:hypothetical protein